MQQLVIQVVSRQYEVRLEENPLILIEIEFSSEDKSEKEASTSSIYLFTLHYCLLLYYYPHQLILYPFYMSQHDINQLLLQIRQQQEQIAALQTLVAVQTRKERAEEGKAAVSRLNTRSKIKVAKPPMFNREASVRATRRKSKYFKSPGNPKSIV